MMSQDGAYAVRTFDLEMTYGKGASALAAIAHLDAVFPAGQASGLVGPDASGKTTLLRILSGLLAPTGGKAMIFGKAASDQAGQIGYMPQHFGLYEDLTVRANLKLQARLRGLPGAVAEERGARLLEFTGLAPFLNRLTGALSGGMKQKLGIACALMGSPRLLLLDEPGVGVDPVSRRELWNMAQELKDGGMTIIWATAYMDEAQKFPHIVMLEEGKAVFQGNPEELVDRAKGRVFLVPQPKVSAESGQISRESLLEWSEREGIADALMEGDNLRLALSPKVPAELVKRIKKAGGSSVDPCLEDAYMIMMGGINHDPSPFSALFRQTSAERSGDVKILCENLTKKFGAFTAARDINIEVRSGEIFGLLGPNGAGKSTTFQMLCGLLRPTSGKCFVDGVNLLHAGSEARSRLGYMAQKFSLYPDLRVIDNIRCWGALYGMSPKKIGEAVGALAPALDLSPWLRQKTTLLPAGLKQRLALMCAAMHNPSALFLDEPTSGVDVRTRRDFWKHISALTNLGTAVLVTTHFMEEAEYCDNIALLYRGSVIRKGSPEKLKKSAALPGSTLEEAFIESIEAYDRDRPL